MIQNGTPGLLSEATNASTRHTIDGNGRFKVVNNGIGENYSSENLGILRIQQDVTNGIAPNQWVYTSAFNGLATVVDPANIGIGQIGIDYAIGGDVRNPSGTLNTRMAEFIVYDGLPDDNKIESYLALKYGITLNNGSQKLYGQYRNGVLGPPARPTGVITIFSGSVLMVPYTKEFHVPPI